MKTKTVRAWTYEDVQKALKLVYGEVGELTICHEIGYIVEEKEPAIQDDPTPMRPQETVGQS